VDVLFILLSLLPLGLGLALHQQTGAAQKPFWSDLAKDMGVVIASVALLDLLWGLVGGEPLSREIQELRSLTILTRQANASGLTGVAVRTSKLEEEQRAIQDFIKTSSIIDMSGFTLDVLQRSPTVLEELVGRAKQGAKIRLLLLAPNNPALPHVVDNERLTAMQAASEAVWMAVQKQAGLLPQDQRSAFTIRRLRMQTLPISIVRFDDRMLVTHYLRYSVTGETPVYVIEGERTPLFKKYISEFERSFAAADAT
jgi:hypothetical protein